MVDLKSIIWPNSSDWCINITSPRNKRASAMISLVLSASHRSHCMTLNPIQYLSAGYVLKWALGKPSCSITWRDGLSSDVLITDSEDLVALRESKRKKSILISSTDGSKRKRQQKKRARQLFVPLLFHPKLISEQMYKQADDLSEKTNRPIKVLFVGNCDSESYSRPQPDSINSRWEIFEAVKALPPEVVVFPTSETELQSLIDSGLGSKRLVWIDTNQFKIRQEKWFEYLCLAQYFVCPAGVRYPYCHNLNEAMACGAVPVLQHHDFYSPVLLDGINSIHFGDLTTLRDVISELLGSSDQQWLDRSNSTKIYHRSFLSLRTVINAIESFMNDADYTLEWQVAGDY